MGWRGNVGVDQSFEDPVQYLKRNEWKEADGTDGVPKAGWHSERYPQFPGGQISTAPSRQRSVSAVMHLLLQQIRLEAIV
jgi:hypothetical protein